MNGRLGSVEMSVGWVGVASMGCQSPSTGTAGGRAVPFTFDGLAVMAVQSSQTLALARALWNSLTNSSVRPEPTAAPTGPIPVTEAAHSSSHAARVAQ